jgi:hypothetical protein
VTAEISFLGDGESNLPDPHFIARHGITNRVTFLVGKTYRIESAFPISCAGVSDSATVVITNSECSLTIVRPVTFSRTDTAARSTGGFGVTVDPPDLNGVFHWTSNACCTVTGLGSLFSTHCDACTCGGCMLGGVYVYEGYALGFGGIPCGCVNSQEGEQAASARISFLSGAVIFENGYTNAPNDIVPRRSTTNSLNITVYGGSLGGSAEIDFDDKGKLAYLTQEAIPRSISVAAEETLELSFPFTAKEENATENDIKARLKFSENFTGDIIESEDEMTAVRVEVEAEADWPENKNRHVFGPAEIAIIKQSPSEPKVYFAQLLPNGGGVMTNGNEWQYTAPAPSSAMIYRINGFCDGGVAFSMYMKTLTPTGYSVFEIKTNCFSSAGQSGGFLMVMKMRLNPLTVSFENLELIEIPRVSTNAVGYYAQESKKHLLDHGRHGAGNWVEVAISNLCFDTVQMGINDPPWLSGGSFTWPIPNAWRVSECEEMLNQFINTDQTFILEPNGDSRVRKFGFIGEKKISGELTIRRE